MFSLSGSSDSALTWHYLCKFTSALHNSGLLNVSYHTSASFFSVGGNHAGETKSKNIKTDTQGFAGAR